MKHEIVCVIKDDRDVITHVRLRGLMNKFTPLEIAKMIEGRNDEFFTYKVGREAKVYWRKHPLTGRVFLTTDPDDTRENNLDFLPRCP